MSNNCVERHWLLKSISKVLDEIKDILLKGKNLPIGAIRNWGGTNYQKRGEKYWVRFDKRGIKPGGKEKKNNIGFAESWAESEGSNSVFDLWGSKEQKEGLGKIIASKTHDVKSIADTKDSGKVKKLKERGWKIFAAEDNVDQIETIMIKRKENKPKQQISDKHAVEARE